MRRILLSLWLVLIAFFSVTTLPMPCRGDGAGHACQTEACTCVATCSCHVAHDLDQTSCHVGSPTDPRPAKHLSPPRTDWQADLPPAPLVLATMPRSTWARTAPPRLHAPDPLLEGPEKPPRSIA